VDALMLTLEITETALMRNPDLAAARLPSLKALGVLIAIDDFRHRLQLDGLPTPDPDLRAQDRPLVHLGRGSIERAHHRVADAVEDAASDPAVEP
jgi:hypothetical protein